MLRETCLKYVEGTKSKLVAFYYTHEVLREAHIKDESELVAFYQNHVKCYMRGFRKFCQRLRGGQPFFLFFLIRGKRIQIALKAGHHRLASETPFKWRFAGGPMMAQH